MWQKSVRFALCILAAVAARAVAQSPSPEPSTPKTAADSVFARARQLVLNGNGAAGRVLVDSMMTVTTPDTPAYAEALYWHASLAATSSDAERDFRRIIVEYPLSKHAGEALLQLAQLEIARGDRTPATTHLQRFLIENPQSPERSRAGLLLLRLAFEQNDPVLGCTFLGRLLPGIPDASVELRNQFTYYSPRCAGVDTNRVVASASTSDSTGAMPDSSVAGHAKAKYTLQVAAYKTRAEADALAKRLKARGLEVRVTGTAKLYRVRIGRYATRAEAAAAARALKAKKIDAFVTEIGDSER
jgi:hypothetical protein